MAKLSTSTDKPKNTRRTIKRLLRYLSRYRYLLYLCLLLSFAGELLSLLGPKFAGSAIGAIKGEGQVDFPTVYHYVKLMLLCYVASAVFSFTLSILMMLIGRKIAANMRRDVFDKLSRLPVSYFDGHATGDLISRVSYDIDVINGSLSTDVIQLVSSFVTVVGAFVMMCWVCPKLVFVPLLTIPMSILWTRFLTKRTRPLFSKRSACYGNMNGFSEEMFAGQKVIQAFVHEDLTEERFRVINETAGDAYYNTEYYGTMMGPTMNFINNLGLCFTAILGSIFYMYNLVTLGDISSFVLYTRKFSGPINELANIANEFLSALAASERVFGLLDEPEEPADASNAEPLTEVKGHVELSHVNFGYVPEKQILHDISLDAEAGKMIAIVGPTGCGKTTIINLLMRFYDPDTGTITVDGKENREITRASLRGSYAMVLQDTWLFHGTVYENIAYGNASATREQVIEAAKATHIHKYIMCLPKGYDTMLTEEGGNISKGQKQLLTIARAMLFNGRMLILDEATSNVDTQTERRIQRAMRKLMKDKTCFVIAHRLSTIRNADKILVLKDGRIEEYGTHDELVASNGLYNTMYQSQFM